MVHPLAGIGRAEPRWREPPHSVICVNACALLYLLTGTGGSLAQECAALGKWGPRFTEDDLRSDIGCFRRPISAKNVRRQHGCKLRQGTTSGTLDHCGQRVPARPPDARSIPGEPGGATIFHLACQDRRLPEPRSCAIARHCHPSGLAIPRSS